MFKAICDFMRSTFIEPVCSFFSEVVTKLDEVSTKAVDTFKSITVIEKVATIAAVSVASMVFIAMAPIWVTSALTVAALAVVARYAYVNTLSFFGKGKARKQRGRK